MLRWVVSSHSMGGFGQSGLQAASAKFNSAKITRRKEMRCILKPGVGMLYCWLCTSLKLAVTCGIPFRVSSLTNSKKVPDTSSTNNY